MGWATGKPACCAVAPGLPKTGRWQAARHSDMQHGIQAKGQMKMTRRITKSHLQATCSMCQEFVRGATMVISSVEHYRLRHEQHCRMQKPVAPTMSCGDGSISMGAQVEDAHVQDRHICRRQRTLGQTGRRHWDCCMGSCIRNPRPLGLAWAGRREAS